jgi:hypothetical protein
MQFVLARVYDLTLQITVVLVLYGFQFRTHNNKIELTRMDSMLTEGLSFVIQISETLISTTPSTVFPTWT